VTNLVTDVTKRVTHERKFDGDQELDRIHTGKPPIPNKPGMEKFSKMMSPPARFTVPVMPGLAVVLFSLQLVSAVETAGWHLEYGPVETVSFTTATHLYAPQGNISEYVVFAAIPPDFGHQHPGPSALLVNGRTFAADRISEKSPCHGQLFYARVPAINLADHTNIAVTVRYQVTLVGRHLKPGSPAKPVAQLRPEEREVALRANAGLDFKTPKFGEWLDKNGLRRRADETAILFGRRACDFAGHHLKWVWPPERAKLSVACWFTTGDCGSFSQLFVGIMRANGIPARSMVGGWVSPGKGPIKGQGHVKSEFYADGVGWVPVDANNLQFGEEQPEFIALMLGDETPLVPHPLKGLQPIGLQDTYLEAIGLTGDRQETRFVCTLLEGKRK